MFAWRILHHATMKFCAVIGCLLLVAGCHESHSNQSRLPDYRMLAPCKRPEKTQYAGLYADSLCGTIPVYENRATRTGRRIDLNVMVIRSRQTSPRPDPVFFLAGGPGQSATETGPPVFSILTRLRKDHDVVLVDQRGTGKSNSLACDAGDDDFSQATSPLDALERLQAEKLRGCLAHYHANPALYTTPAAMDDLNEVRQRLGFDKIDLYGISYGTRAALVYMRRHGNTVRSAILDSVAPLTMAIPAKIAVDAQYAFDRMLADCSKQEGCRRAFPDLGTHFDILLARLRAKPARITLDNPRTGAKVRVLMEAGTLTSMVRATLYERTLSTLLPLALHDAWRGNYQPIATLAYTLGDAETDFSTGMMASVLCSEDMRITHGPDNTKDFDNVVYDSIAPVCRFWPRGKIPFNYFTPVKSGVPTLLLAGALDPVTPPKYAFEAAKTLTDSRVVVVPGVGHTASLQGCLPDLLARFLDSPSPGKLDTGCVGILKRPVFFTSPAGTALPEERDRD